MKNRTCEGCTYYQPQDLICGQGNDPTQQDTEGFCLQRKDGPYATLEGKPKPIWAFLQNIGLEQSPKALRKRPRYKLVYFKMMRDSGIKYIDVYLVYKFLPQKGDEELKYHALNNIAYEAEIELRGAIKEYYNRCYSESTHYGDLLGERYVEMRLQIYDMSFLRKISRKATRRARYAKFGAV